MVATSTEVVASFSGDAPLYRHIQVELRAPAFAASRLAREIVDLPTEARALVRGTVRLANGSYPPSPATVSAYLLRDGLPEQPRVAATNTNRFGKYELQVPVAGDLLLVAVAMQESGLLHGSSLTTGNGAIATSGRRNAALQPASALVCARLCAAVEAPPLQLAASADVEVTVTGAAGPAARVPLLLTYAPDMFLDYGVCWWRDGSCAATSQNQTDAEGRAVLLGAAGRRAQLVLDYGTSFTDVVPPDRVALTLPPR